MMAFREQRDGIHVAGLQRVLPFILVKGQSDSRNRRRCVEIQMNLSETKVMHKTSSMPKMNQTACHFFIYDEIVKSYNKIHLPIKNKHH